VYAGALQSNVESRGARIRRVMVVVDISVVHVQLEVEEMDSHSPVLAAGQQVAETNNGSRNPFESEGPEFLFPPSCDPISDPSAIDPKHPRSGRRSGPFSPGDV
jgi:hypothetical protein